MAKAIKLWLGAGAMLIAALLVGCSDEPTPSPLPSPSATQAPAPIASAIDTPSPSPVPTATPAQTATPYPTATATLTPEPAATPTQTVAPSPTIIPASEPTATPAQPATPTPTATLTAEPTATPVQPATPTPTIIPAPEPTATPIPTPSAAPAANEIAAVERDALVALYNSTGGANWERNDNWLGDEPLHTWYGVRTVGGRVSELHLGGNGLTGNIPPELGNLAHLRELRFGDDNRLTGEIPDELSKLTRLEVLDLGLNDMTGPIPAWLGGLKRLRALYLDNNRFEGELPEELGNLSRLESLPLSGNRGLMGALPDSLTRIEGLRWFIFHETGLCAPTDQNFQAWLLNVPDREGPDCLEESFASNDMEVANNREALVALYNSTGGANWERNDNWLSDEPLDTWYGVRTGNRRARYRARTGWQQWTEGRYSG